MTMIDRGNFYRLVCRSNKEKAREFESQVFDVILVEIGETGSFVGPDAKPQLPSPSPDLALMETEEGRCDLIARYALEKKALILHNKSLASKNQELEKANQAMLPAFNWVEKIREAGIMWDFKEATTNLAIANLGPQQLREYLVKKGWIFDRNEKSNQARKAQGKKQRHEWTPYSHIGKAGYMKNDLRVYDKSLGTVPDFISDYRPIVLLIDGMLKLVEILKADGYVSTTQQHQDKAKRIIEWAVENMKKAA